jgi:uncharacterized phage protein gp47/JayE
MAPDWRSMLGLQTMDELLTTAFTRLQEAGSAITNLNVGGVFRTLLELSSQGVADLHGLLELVLPQGFARYATGAWLDLHAQDVGLTRHPATQTEGEVVFFRTGSSGNVAIPAGVIVRTLTSSQGEQLEYQVATETILPDGETEAAVPVQASTTGSRYNVAAGMIAELVTHVAGVEGVRNDEDWITSEGTDQETDANLRQRHQERWPALASGATAAAYRSWAREIAGVVDVGVDDAFPRGEGTADVIITGTAGQPSAELVDEVQALIDDRKPLCSDILVRGPGDIETPVRVRVYLPLDRGDEDAVEVYVLERVGSLLSSGDVEDVPRLSIGQNLTRARLFFLAMGAPEAWNVDVELPAADVVAGDGDLVSLDGAAEVIVERAEP